VVVTILSVTVVGGIVTSKIKVDETVTLSVIVTVTGGSVGRVILFVIVTVEVIGVAEAHVNGQADGVIVTVVGGGHEEAEALLLDEVDVEVVVEEGELVLEEVIATPAMQIQALLIFELTAEHGDKKLGKDEVAVTRVVVYVAQNGEATAAFP
jgi:hypothetical protein